MIAALILADGGDAEVLPASVRRGQPGRGVGR